MSTTPKRYRLLKDLPGLKSREIFVWSDQVDEYVQERFLDEIEKDGDFGNSYHFCYNIVEADSEYFFEPITETPTEDWKWTDELVKDWGSYIRLREPNFEINEELQKWKQSKSNQSHIPKDFSLETREAETNSSTPPPKERIRVGGFCYIGASIDALRSNTRYYEYSFKTTRAIDPYGLIDVIEKAINQ